MLSSLSELIQDGFNGLVFNSDQELAEQIYALVENFPDQTKMHRLKGLMEGVQKWKQTNGSFQDHWQDRVWPFLS